MSTRKAFFWSVAGQIFSFLVNFVGSVVVARLLSPAEMGIYVIGVATIGLIAGVTTLGVGAYVVREPVLTKDVLDTAHTLNALLATGLALVVFLIGQASAFVLGSREAGHVMTLLAVTPLAGVLTFRPATLLQRDMQFKALSLIGTATAATGTAVTIAAAFAGASYMAPAWGNVAGATAGMIGYLVFGREHIGFAMSLSHWRAILTFGLRMVTISGAASMSARIADISLGRLLGLRALGLYSRASSLSGQIFDNVYGAATRVVFVHLSQENRTKGELAEAFLRSFRMITAALWPALMGLAALSPVVITHLYGPKWLAAAPVLSVLMLAQVVALFFGMNWELFVIKNETALQTKIELGRNVLGLAIFTIGCTFSLAGAALGRLCDNLLGLALYRRHVTRLSGISPAALNRAYVEGTGLAVATVAPVAVLMACEHWSPDTPLPLAIGATALGMAIWAAGLVWLRHPLVEEAAAVARAARRRLPACGLRGQPEA